MDGEQNFVGVGGLQSSARAGVRGNGGKIDGDPKFVGIGGLQCSVRAGVRRHGGMVGRILHINMLMIDDRMRMLRGVPAKMID